MQTMDKFKVYADMFAICNEENACKNLIKAAEEKSEGSKFNVLFANKMNRNSPKDADVIINAEAESEEIVESVIKSLSNIQGVKEIRFRISKH